MTERPLIGDAHRYRPATLAQTVSEGLGGSRWIVSIMGGTSVRRGRKLSNSERRWQRARRS